MIADLDDLLTAPYVLADDLLPRRPPARRRPPITDAELLERRDEGELIGTSSKDQTTRCCDIAEPPATDWEVKRPGHLDEWPRRQPGRPRVDGYLTVSVPSIPASRCPGTEQ